MRFKRIRYIIGWKDAETGKTGWQVTEHDTMADARKERRWLKRRNRKRSYGIVPRRSDGR
jgi:hypothetical protein